MQKAVCNHGSASYLFWLLLRTTFLRILVHSILSLRMSANFSDVTAVAYVFRPSEFLGDWFLGILRERFSVGFRLNQASPA